MNSASLPHLAIHRLTEEMSSPFSPQSELATTTSIIIPADQTNEKFVSDLADHFFNFSESIYLTVLEIQPNHEYLEFIFTGASHSEHDISVIEIDALRIQFSLVTWSIERVFSNLLNRYA
jgi:hypothetical protein